jgi:hypothetical protein
MKKMATRGIGTALAVGAIVALGGCAGVGAGALTVGMLGMSLSILLGLAGCTSSHIGGGSDADGDGYGSEVDCDDDDPSVHPGADEMCENGCGSWGDGVDNNCNGEIDEYEACVNLSCNLFDGDGDGYTSDQDCNDADPSIHPGADEQCYEDCDGVRGDGVDNDCDGEIDEYAACVISSCNAFYDEDGDGWGVGFGPGPDCDDSDPTVHPEAPETACDGVDSNCDGEDNPEGPPVLCDVDDDGDGHPAGLDCDDTNPAVSPSADEACADGVDNDCDEAIDEEVCVTTGS